MSGLSPKTGHNAFGESSTIARARDRTELDTLLCFRVPVMVFVAQQPELVVMRV
jgi:hypothetical protein